jgi:two-component system response regulator HydG
MTPRSNPAAALPQGRLGQLCELARIISGSFEQKKVQDAILVGAMSLADADYGSIQLLERGSPETFHLDRWEGSLEGDSALRCDRLVAPWVARHAAVLRSGNLAADSRFPPAEGEACATAVLAAPILHHKEPIAVLILGRPAGQPFTDEEEMLVTTVADLASSALFAIRHLKLVADENRRLKGKIAGEGGLSGLIGRSPAWHQICTVLRNVGPSEARILLLGESGTGKEMVARAAHDLSARREKAFVAVNCAAMPENLAESELFGYVKGAFTGAAQDRHGLFVEADNGTLFLDEVGSATPQLQSSLLRAIQEGEIRPVGSTVPLRVDVRLICATSCDLERMVQEGSFRKDLYFRINVVSLTLPPLRDRREDVSLLAQEFLNRLGRKNSRRIEALTPEALVALERYDWPGNVRELENAVEHAILFTPPESHVVPAQALPPRVLGRDGTPARPQASDGLSLDARLGAYEREIVKSTLDRCGWNQSEAARALQVSEKRIRNRIKEYGLRRSAGELPAST